ncbi:MAG: glycerophosphodiester phosphodiesterase [Planctomycetota bacterium]
MAADSGHVLSRLRALRDRERLLVVAHRGDSEHAPENTLPAFEAAAALGADAVEFDVRASADGVLFCLHDSALDRTTDAARRFGPGAEIFAMQSADLAALDAGSWKDRRFAGTRLARLDEALDCLLPRTVPMIEHKSGDAAWFVELLARRRDRSRVLLQSFDLAFLRAVRALDQSIPLGVLGPREPGRPPDERTLDEAQALSACFVHWEADALTKDSVRRTHGRGLLCFSYTSDDRSGWSRGQRIGLDGMCTNRPGDMLAWRTGRPAAR